MADIMKKLYDDFTENFEDKPDWVIDFYSKNHLLLSNIKTFKCREDLTLYIEITWMYMNALFQKDRLNETVDAADRTLPVIDSELARLETEEHKEDGYYGILFLKGMSLYRLRDYKTATPVFKQLTEADSKNDSYRNWLNHSSYGQKSWLMDTFNIICGLLVLAVVFLREYIESFETRITILGFALLGFVGNWGYEYYMKRSFRKTIKQ